LHAATFDDPLDAARANQRLRAALSLEGEWLPEVLAAAHARLSEIRRTQLDAGGLVIATDQEHARGIAQIIRQRLNSQAIVAVSDDPLASQRIRDFAAASAPWLVAVRMVSEGVDIPRLRVGVFATTTTTELFFRQAVGRLVRWQAGLGRQAAYLFIPDDVRLRVAAAQIADDRRHSLHRREEAERSEDEGSSEFDEVPVATGEEQLSLFSMISAVATDAIIPDDEPADEPVFFEEDPSLTLELPAAPSLAHGGLQVPGVDGQAPLTRMEVKEQLRLANGAVVRALVQQTGLSHSKVNAELNRLSGLRRVADATVRQLESRLRHGERWCSRL
jgi:superfamily II DNA or RNA helicase